MTGLAAKAGGQTFANLPSELKDFSSPQITRIYASDGRTQISQFYDEFRSDVPLRDISKHMRDAMVAMGGDPKFEDSQNLPGFPYAEYARMLGLGAIRVDSHAQRRRRVAAQPVEQDV